MLISPNFLRSLFITSTFSFAVPVVLIGIILMGLSLVEQIPLLAEIGRVGAENLFQFLAVFGSGNAVEGVLVIGCTCSLVGALFDTYAFYRHHNLRDS